MYAKNLEIAGANAGLVVSNALQVDIIWLPNKWPELLFVFQGELVVTECRTAIPSAIWVIFVCHRQMSVSSFLAHVIWVAASSGIGEGDENSRRVCIQRPVDCYM